jgi:hypothetical protein
MYSSKAVKHCSSPVWEVKEVQQSADKSGERDKLLRGEEYGAKDALKTLT